MLLRLVLTQAGKVLTTIRTHAALEGRFHFNDVIIVIRRLDILVNVGKMPLDVAFLGNDRTTQGAAKISNRLTFSQLNVPFQRILCLQTSSTSSALEMLRAGMF